MKKTIINTIGRIDYKKFNVGRETTVAGLITIAIGVIATGIGCAITDTNCELYVNETDMMAVEYNKETSTINIRKE